MAADQAVYSHGHHESVMESHARRTAQNSMAFLLPHLRPSFHVLDVGCGPGTITVDIARLVPQGKVVGGDTAKAAVEQAQALAQSQGVSNLTFQTFDGKALPFADGSFDVAFCHQVLQHFGDPVALLAEMRRVVKPGGGIVAARDADYASFTWYPEYALIDRWAQVYRRIAHANGGQPNAGRYLRAWAAEAGFPDDSIESTWSTWHYEGDDAVAWSRSWNARVLYSGYATSARQHGFASDSELQNIGQAWLSWGKEPYAFIRIPSGEILCRKQA